VRVMLNILNLVKTRRHVNFLVAVLFSGSHQVYSSCVIWKEWDFIGIHLKARGEDDI
jgi:hypothetical protein